MLKKNKRLNFPTHWFWLKVSLCVSFATKDWFLFFYFPYSRARKQVSSQHAPQWWASVLVFFTRSWTTIVGFAAWEVGCLRAEFNASGRVRLVPSCLFIDIAHGHIHVQQSPDDGCCWEQLDDCDLWWQLFSLREFWGVCVWHLHAPFVSENSLISDSFSGSNSFVHDLRSVCFSSVSELKQIDLSYEERSSNRWMSQTSNCFQKHMVHGDAKHKHLRTHAGRIIAITNHSHQVAFNNNHR